MLPTHNVPKSEPVESSIYHCIRSYRPILSVSLNYSAHAVIVWNLLASGFFFFLSWSWSVFLNIWVKHSVVGMFHTIRVCFQEEELKMATQLTGPVMPIKTVRFHLKLQLLPALFVYLSDLSHLIHMCRSTEPDRSSQMMTNLRNLCIFLMKLLNPFCWWLLFMGFNQD